jgi:hypothetical protein
MQQSKEKRSLDYTTFDFAEKLTEYENFLRETNTFKDFEVQGSNIRVLMELLAMQGSQNSFYTHAAANEIFKDTAKLYKSLNKIGNTLRYSARGKTSSTVDVIGSLNPGYVYGKVSQYIEIPAYSIFPSTVDSPDGSSFSFTNPLPVVYIVKGFGIRELQAEDIRYRGYVLPFTAPKSFFRLDANTIGLDPTFITLPLSLTKPLSIIKKNSSDNYRGFDTENYPLTNKSDNQSVGQPFNKTIRTQEYGSTLVPNTSYALVFNLDTSTSSPYLTIAESSNVINDKQDDVICTFTLEPTDSTEAFYSLKIDEMRSHNRFYVGVTGLRNLESCRIEYDPIPGRDNSVERMKLVVNKDGNSAPLSVLVNGKIFTFNSGVIYSQKIPVDFWDTGVEEYNVHLVITDELSPETNYGAQLLITSQEPISNQITIAKINTKYTDPQTNTRTLESTSGKRFGDMKFVEKSKIKTSEQKAGRLYFQRGERLQRIIFDSPFVKSENEDIVSYITNITPEGNVRTWYANKTDKGFDIYIEPESQFEGYVAWTATRTIEGNFKEVQVEFNESIPSALNLQGSSSNYMVQLTPNENIQVWYEDPTPYGFKIRTEKEFTGKISWSIFNYFGGDMVPVEVESAYRQRGTIVVNPSDAENGVEITLDVPMNERNYAIQLIPNKNVNVFYSNKTSNGFFIKAEQTKEIVTVDWYVDSSEDYLFQKHGEIDFAGQSSNELQIPGLYFSNVPETFEIPNLIQGNVCFTYINSNTVVDSSNNGMKMSLDPSRQFQTDVRFIVDDLTISTNGIRVFVKNERGTWDEWKRAGTGFDEDVSPGNLVFFVKVNPDKKVIIEFGDGEVWGESILNKEAFILGLKSIGKDGDISKNVLSDNIIVSQYILGNDTTNISFEKNFVSLLGLKSSAYFEGGKTITSIIDSEKTKLRDGDLRIIQNKNAFGGNEVESVDEIRQNLTNSFIRQDRNVSLNDYERYVKETFNNYLQESKVLSYEQAKSEGLITGNQNYWFNHIFIIGLNKDGSNVISRNLKDAMINSLNGSTFKMLGAQHEILEAKWVPVDVAIRYKKTRFGSAEQVETQMRKNVQDFFNPKNHTLGGKISHSDMVSLLKVDYVESVEVMLNKDPNNNFNANDYDINIRQSSTDIDISRRNKLMTLVAKDPSLIKVFQPLFDTMKTDGTREWNYSLDIQFGSYEFPKIGDVIIKRED